MCLCACVIISVLVSFRSLWVVVCWCLHAFYVILTVMCLYMCIFMHVCLFMCVCILRAKLNPRSNQLGHPQTDDAKQRQWGRTGGHTANDSSPHVSVLSLDPDYYSCPGLAMPQKSVSCSTTECKAAQYHSSIGTG